MKGVFICLLWVFICEHESQSRSVFMSAYGSHATRFIVSVSCSVGLAPPRSRSCLGFDTLWSWSWFRWSWLQHWGQEQIMFGECPIFFLIHWFHAWKLKKPSWTHHVVVVVVHCPLLLTWKTYSHLLLADLTWNLNVKWQSSYEAYTFWCTRGLQGSITPNFSFSEWAVWVVRVSNFFWPKHIF